MMGKFDNTIDMVLRETKRQTRIFGEQNHENYKWDSILSEEKGEVSHTILESEYPNTKDTLIEELVHVAAVCFNWIGCLDRAKKLKRNRDCRDYLRAVKVEKEILND